MSIDWEKVNGLLPVIIQNDFTLEVLMLGFMNEEALEKTIDEKRVTFYSRSKKRLWTKGESSGHFLEVKSMHLDCDRDSLLIFASPNGPTCHLGTPTCFDKEGLERIDIHLLAKLYQTIENRFDQSDTNQSYTASLFASGIKRMAQKVGEEGVEVAIAAVSEDRENLKAESVDLIYHLLVLIKGAQLPFEEVLKEVLKRMK